MELINTGFNDLILLKPNVFEDSRGHFFESYNKLEFFKSGISINFVQDNQSLSSYGVIRGLHYQLHPYAQSKLVRVLRGSIFDVAIDLRKGSPTFSKWYGIEISEQNKLQLLIPRGFAHGFSVLSDQAIVLYKTDDYYNKEAERGIIYNDPELAIDWKLNPADSVVSARDKSLPKFSNAEFNFFL